jgi:hypothetical protein
MFPLAAVVRILASGFKMAQRRAGIAASQRVYTRPEMRRDVLSRDEPFPALPWMETA